MEKIIFYILALIIVVFAIASVTSKKMLRSVIYLLFVLCGIAGIYFLIDYNFLAAIQLTVYAGGIIVLIIFSVIVFVALESSAEPERQVQPCLKKPLPTAIVMLSAKTLLWP